jgi:hypothetical protein
MLGDRRRDDQMFLGALPSLEKLLTDADVDVRLRLAPVDRP